MPFGLAAGRADIMNLVSFNTFFSALTKFLKNWVTQSQFGFLQRALRPQLHTSVHHQSPNTSYGS